MPPEVTLRQLAKKSGLSLASISLALRDSPKISLANRAAIQALADQLGYRPNPLVTAGMTKIRASKQLRYNATLAWVNDHPESDFWKKQTLWHAAKARAQQLGFMMDELYLPDISIEHPEKNVERFCKVARARGIHGVILPHLERSHHAQEDWPDTAVVVIGEVAGLLHNSKITPRRLKPCYHTVVEDYFGNVQLAFDELHARGYQRIGFTGSEWLNTQHDHIPRAAVVEINTGLSPDQRVPPLITKSLTSKDGKDFARWVAHYKPDVILTMHYDVTRWLRAIGLHYPSQIGLAHIAIGPLEEGWSGVDPCEEVKGVAAVDLLTAQLLRNERGFPTYIKRVGIAGRWVDGTTARKAACG